MCGSPSIVPEVASENMLTRLHFALPYEDFCMPNANSRRSARLNQIKPIVCEKLSWFDPIASSPERSRYGHIPDARLASSCKDYGSWEATTLAVKAQPTNGTKAYQSVPASASLTLSCVSPTRGTLPCFLRRSTFRPAILLQREGKGCAIASELLKFLKNSLLTRGCGIAEIGGKQIRRKESFPI